MRHLATATTDSFITEALLSGRLSKPYVAAKTGGVMDYNGQPSGDISATPMIPGPGTSVLTIDCASDVPWTVTSDTAWITPSTTAGTGASEVNIVYEANPSTAESRSGSVVVTYTYNGNTYTRTQDYTQTKKPRNLKLVVQHTDPEGAEAEYTTPTIYITGQVPGNTIYGRKNDGEWQTLQIVEAGQCLYFSGLTTGDTIEMYGLGSAWATEESAEAGSRTVTTSYCDYTVEGDISSMVMDQTFPLTSTHTFRNFFAGCVGASGLCLDIADMSQTSDAYGFLVGGEMGVNSGLTSLPDLTKIEKLGHKIFSHFAEGTAITEVPALPWTGLTNTCYSNMFKDCTQLTDISNLVLPATELKDYCYSVMFQGCTALTTAMATLPATGFSGSKYAYNFMFRNCTSLETPPAFTVTMTSDDTYCMRGMFGGCINLSDASQIVLKGVVPSVGMAQMFNTCGKMSKGPNVTGITGINASGCSQTFMWCVKLGTESDGGTVWSSLQYATGATAVQAIYQKAIGMTGVTFGSSAMTSNLQVGSTTTAWRYPLSGCTSLSTITFDYPGISGSTQSTFKTGIPNTAGSKVYKRSGVTLPTWTKPGTNWSYEDLPSGT